jgi:hypothetical protein
MGPKFGISLLADPAYVLAKMFQLALLVVLVAWVVSLGGLSSTDGVLSFNWHPLLMVLAFPVFMADALMAYRLERELNLSHLAAKSTHATLHSLALAFTAAGVAAIVVNHEQNGIAPLYSAHSWLGLSTLILLAAQFFLALFLFVGNLTPAHLRKQALPVHRAFGLSVFALGLATMLTGITEKQHFLKCPNGGKFCYKKMLAGAAAVLLAAVGVSVGFVIVNNKPTEEDDGNREARGVREEVMGENQVQGTRLL